MPMVRPTLRCDVVKLMGAFCYGYKPHSCAIYVSVTDDEGHSRVVTQEDVQHWSPWWIQENDAFENSLKSNLDFVGLSGSMFFIYDGNYRLLAWKEVIETLHVKYQHWFPRMVIPNALYLTPLEVVEISSLSCTISTGNFLLISYCFLSSYLALDNFYNLTCQLCRSNQTAHVKTSLVHTLHRIRKYGSYDIEYFKPMLTLEQIKSCLTKSKKTWYPLTRDLMVNFILSVRISFPSGFFFIRNHLI